jgi:PAS domain S-box-containing protein
LLELLANIGIQLGRVAERSRAQKALEESQGLLREAQALGRLGSWHTNLHTGETRWSDELYDILGLNRSLSPPGLATFLAVVHPEDRELVEIDTFQGLDSGEADASLEFRLVRPDGEFRWVVRRRSFARSDAGDVVALQMTVQDITEHKRATQCALTCEVRWQIMLQGSREVLSLLTEDGNIFFSLAPVGTSSLSTDDGSSRALVDAVHPDDAATVAAMLDQLLANPDDCVAFLARFFAEGEWRWFHSIATNLLDEPLIGAIVVNSQDVTELKDLHERLAQVAGHR